MGGPGRHQPVWPAIVQRRRLRSAAAVADRDAFPFGRRRGLRPDRVGHARRAAARVQDCCLGFFSGEGHPADRHHQLPQRRHRKRGLYHRSPCLPPSMAADDREGRRPGGSHQQRTGHWRPGHSASSGELELLLGRSQYRSMLVPAD